MEIYTWVTFSMVNKMDLEFMIIKIIYHKNMAFGRTVNKYVYLINNKLIKLITNQLIIELSFKINKIRNNN